LHWSGLQNQRLKQEKSRTAQIPTAVKPFLALPTQSPQLKTYHNNSKVSPHPFQKKKSYPKIKFILLQEHHLDLYKYTQRLLNVLKAIMSARNYLEQIF